MLNDWAAVVLAAGTGTRMRSHYPKVLHPVAGKPMLVHILDVVAEAQLSRSVVVVGHDGEAVRAAVGEGAEFVEQEEALGTGHAVLQARGPLLGGPQHALVLYGDTPLVRANTLQRAIEHHLSTGAIVTIATCQRTDAKGLGRVLRSEYGSVLAVIEEAEASEEQLTIPETNEGIYCFETQWLWDRIKVLRAQRNGEYYLTDMVGMAAAEGHLVESIAVQDPTETMGINDRMQLAQAEGVMRQRVCERLMLSGVTLLDPLSTYIDADVEIGQDTVVHPNTTIGGKTTVGRECQIGPGAMIRDSQVGDRCQIVASMVEESTIEQNVTIGPFSHLRPGSYIEAEVHLGNYVEVKNSRIGGRTQVGHFSYIGDATLGKDVNIGAGTVTCNYDGVEKHPTHIGDGAFIGSDTMLVAPVTVGAGASTGAGSVVTKDVPPNKLAVGMPARTVPQHVRKEGKRDR